jgi:lipoprotein-anchoring transpeptidase ErfK/SrfK
MLAILLAGCDEINSPESEVSSAQATADRERAPLVNRHVRVTLPNKALSDILKEENIGTDSEFNIYIDLKTRSLMFRHEDKVLKRYSIGAGQNTTLGDKQKEGDMRTPRGEFYICSKEAYQQSRTVAEGNLGTRWMQLSYPNMEAAERGLENNLISKEAYDKIKEAIENKKKPPQNTPLGSVIGIHGGAKRGNARDWTAGCIGMYNKDVEEIFKYLKVGDRVQIRWGYEE